MAEWVTGLMESAGYAAVAFLMFLENLFPPIPSEVVMPFAGYTAAQGGMSLLGAVAAGIVGSVAGAVFWYWIGRSLGEARVRRFAARYGRWVTLTPRELDEAIGWFGRHGRTAVLVGRLIPAVRTFISIPAGICGMPFGRFLAYTTVGTAAWTGLLAAAGYLLGSQWKSVGTWLGPASWAVIGIALVWYLVRLVRHGRRGETAR